MASVQIDQILTIQAHGYDEILATKSIFRKLLKETSKAGFKKMFTEYEAELIEHFNTELNGESSEKIEIYADHDTSKSDEESY